MLTEEDKSGPDACLQVAKILVDSINAVKAEFKAIYNDKELPLAERWYFYSQVPFELREYALYTVTVADIDSYYDAVNADRYQKVHFDDIIDRIEEAKEDPTNEYVIQEFVNLDLDAVKEEILATGLHGCINDW